MLRARNERTKAIRLGKDVKGMGQKKTSEGASSPAPRTRPRKIARAAMERYIIDYIKEVYASQEAGKADVPTRLGLERFISERESISHRSLLCSLEGKNGALFEDLSADLLSRGGILGLYNASMTALTLKNRCRWRDRAEGADTPKDSELNIKIKVI